MCIYTVCYFVYIFLYTSFKALRDTEDAHGRKTHEKNIIRQQRRRFGPRKTKDLMFFTNTFTWLTNTRFIHRSELHVFYELCEKNITVKIQTWVKWKNFYRQTNTTDLNIKHIQSLAFRWTATLVCDDKCRQRRKITFQPSVNDDLPFTNPAGREPVTSQTLRDERLQRTDGSENRRRAITHASRAVMDNLRSALVSAGGVMSACFSLQTAARHISEKTLTLRAALVRL